MTALENPGPVFIDEYLLGEVSSGVKHEYIGGVIHAKAGGSNQHNAIASNALAFLLLQLQGKPCQSFNSDTKVRIEFADHTRFYYPDAMVVCHPNPVTDHFQDQPVVVIEVLSESTRRTDLGEKRDAYLALPSLKVLMLVESDRPLATVHRRKAQGGFAIETHSGLETVIELPEIGASLALADLYQRAEF